MDNELYASDEDAGHKMDHDRFIQHDDPQCEELDLGMGSKDNAPKKQFNLFNKKSAVDAADLNNKIQ